MITLLFAFIVFPVVWFMLANEARRSTRKTVSSAGQDALGPLVLLPIIGSFVWYLRMQRSLNTFGRPLSSNSSGFDDTGILHFEAAFAAADTALIRDVVSGGARATS